MNRAILTDTNIIDLVGCSYGFFSCLFFVVLFLLVVLAQGLVLFSVTLSFCFCFSSALYQLSLPVSFLYCFVFSLVFWALDCLSFFSLRCTLVLNPCIQLVIISFPISSVVFASHQKSKTI